jgi:excisionase family DNA binding protein
MEEREDLITISQAAKLRGVSRRAIYQLIYRGRLKAYERYGLMLVSRKEVENFESLYSKKKDKN